MRLAVVIFHKNVQNYPAVWIKRCVDSIKNQTYKEFSVFELDYGGGNTQIYDGSNFASHELNDHAEAHNFILDVVFNLGYDYAYNINVDDHYAPERIERQLVYARKGYDVISSNFYNVDENDVIVDTMCMSDKNILIEAAKGHNIIAHPACCYSRKFWMGCSKLIPSEIPFDDFGLWKRSFDDYSFVICPEYLLYYRVHSKKVSKPTDSQEQRPAGTIWASEEERKQHDARREEWLKLNR